MTLVEIKRIAARRGRKLQVYTNNVAEIIGNHNLNSCSKADIYIRVVCKFNTVGKYRCSCFLCSFRQDGRRLQFPK